MEISPVKFHPIVPAWPVRRRRSEFEDLPEGETIAEPASEAQTSRPQFQSEQRQQKFDDSDPRRRSRGLGLVAARVAFQAQQYAQEHLGQGLHYESWKTAAAAYERWSQS